MWPGIGNWGFLAVDGKSIGAELDRFLDPSRPKHSAQVNPLPTDAEKELQALAFRTLPVSFSGLALPARLACTIPIVFESLLAPGQIAFLLHPYP